jgi:uncharacterized protein YbjT (DUF2867 family)
MIATISPAMLTTLRRNGEQVTLIDVRTPAEFGELHVDFAHNIPLDRLDAKAVTALSGDGPVYFVCKSGNRSQKACEKLLATGLKDVISVEGGTAACEAAGVARFVHVSAIGADVNSEADYGRSKGEAEAAARAVKPDTVILRPSIVFGTGDGFLNRFAAMAGTAPALPLIGGGRTKFQPVWVGDVAEAIARSVSRLDAAGRTFELGGPEVWSFKDILKYILRETGKMRLLAPLPVFVAATMGRVMQLSSLVGIPPVLTRDQVLMLKVDNVVAPGAEGLAALGIEPTGLEAIAPSYLWRYRRGGQFARNPGAPREDAVEPA